MGKFIAKTKSLSREPLWVALISLGLLGIGVIPGVVISGLTGLIIAFAPLGIFLVLLCVVNPYPFWLGFFFLTPFTYIIQDLFPLGSFVRFLGVILVVLTTPYILLSKRSPQFKVTAVGGSLMVFFLGCSLSLLSFFETDKALYGLFLFLGNLLAYWVFVNLFKEEKKIRTILNIFIAVLSAQAIIAVALKFITHPLARATGTMSDPNYFGMWLLPFMCIAFYLGIASEKKLHKYLYLGGYLLMTLALPFTYSRSMLLIFVPMQFFLYWRFKKLPLFFGIALISAVLLYLGFASIFAKTGFSISSILTGTRVGSITWRTYFAVTAIRIFLDHPLIGVGVDNFWYIFRFYSQITPHIAFQAIHNSFLEILAGTGLAGIIPFVAVILFSFRNFWQVKNYFKKIGDRRKFLFAEAILVGFVAFLMANVFLSAQHHIIFYLLIAFSTILYNLAFDKDTKLVDKASRVKQSIH